MSAQSADPALARQIAAHLEQCPACQDELGELPAAFIAPTSAIPPPQLVANIMARLPATPALAQAQERRGLRRQRLLWGSVAAFMVLLMAVGSLGMLVDSALPASWVGGADSSLGRGLLALTLAGKPLIAALGTIGIPLALSAILLASAGTWAWQRLLAAPALQLAEVEQ